MAGAAGIAARQTGQSMVAQAVQLHAVTVMANHATGFRINAGQATYDAFYA
jgi:hypothetical protein